MIVRHPLSLLAAALTAGLLPQPDAAADWLQFRGTAGNGLATEVRPPLTGNLNDAERWRIDLPGRGLSSPILIGDRVFLTTSSGPDQRRLHVLCFDAATGRPVWERRFWATGRTMTHDKTCVASCTPASDGKRLFALFSSNDLFCLDLDGNLLWLRGLTQDYPNASNSLGMASSPMYVAGALVVQAENDSESFAAGIDPETGANLWKMDRPKAANWTSPQILHDPATGRAIAALQSSKGITAVDPQSGSELWNYTDGASTIPSSAAFEGKLFIPSHGLTVLEPGRTGEPKQLWRSGQLRPGTASPLAMDGKVYTVNNAGILTCGELATGKRLWQLRTKGPFSASPVAAGPFIYLVNEKGLVQVVDTSPEEEGVVTGSLDLKATILGTPSISGGALYVRSDKHLWKLGGS